MPDIKFAAADVSAMKLGTTTVTKVYHGASEIWPASAPTYTDVLLEDFANLTDAPWTTLGGTPTIVAARTGNGLSCAGSTAAVRYSIAAPYQLDTITIGFAFRVSSIGATRTVLSLWAAGGSGVNNSVRVLTNGAIDVQRAGTTIATSAATGLVAINTWYYLETQIKIHDTTGTAIVRLNGTERINATSLDTAGSGAVVFGDVRFGPAGSGSTQLWDDLYVTMGAGAPFKGDITIAAPAFSPADIPGLRGWWDPDDTATITLSGSNITDVQNKGNVDFDLTPGDTITQGTQNGRKTFNFGAGTGYLHYSGGATVVSGTACSVIQVLKKTGGGSSPRVFSMFAATGDDWNSPGGAVAIGSGDPSFPSCYRNFGQKSYGNPPSSESVWHIVMSIFDGTNHTMHVNGVANTPVASTDTFATVRITVGAGNGGSQRWAGEMGDVLVYQHALDSTQRADLRTYLQTKWGL